MPSFELTGSGAGITALVTWTETVLEDENTSVLEVNVEVKSSQWYGISYFLSGTAAGKTFDKATDYVYLGAKNSYYPIEGMPITMTVEHAMDGSGTATIALDLTGATRSGGAGSGWKLQGSRTVELTPIIRASTVEATDADVGGVSTIAVSRRNDAYCHSLQYSFGTLSGYIAADGSAAQEPVMMTAAAIAFAIPEAFYDEIPDSPTGLCMVSCTTWEGSTQIGVPMTAVFTVTAPASVCAPTVTGRVGDVNEVTRALTGDPYTLVRFYSTARCEITTQPKNGASMVSRTVDGVAAPAEFAEIDRDTFLFAATDTRGYRTELPVTVNLIPYVKLTVNAVCRRMELTSGQAQLTVRGSCFNGSFGVLDNSLTLTATVGDRTVTLSPRLSAEGYSAEVVLEDMDYAESHLITVTAQDALEQVVTQVELRRGVPVFDWGKGDFAFHVPVTAPSINGFQNLALCPWPVGAVMMTVDDVSPALSIGGKWEKLEDLGIDLNLWQRLREVDLLGTAVLGTMLLGEA